MDLVYICSPYKAYDNVTVEDNLEKAKKYCKMASDKGYIPICPHLYFTQFLDDECEEKRNVGMEMGIDLLKRCNEIWIFGGRRSMGMTKEIFHAINHNMEMKFFDENCKEVTYDD